AKSMVENPETRWPDGRIGELVLRYDGTDGNNDSLRLEAAALALFEANSSLANDTRSLKQTLETLKVRIATDTQKVDNLKRQAEHERAIYDARPTRELLDKLKADDSALEAAYNAALRRVKDAQVELDQLKTDAAKNASPEGDPLANDKDLQAMQKNAD